jgi:zinc protease
MNTQRFFLAALAGLLLLPGLAAAKKWEKIKSPTLHPIQPPAVERQALDNGIQLFVLEDHDLPLFRMTLVLRAGEAYAPAEQRGLPGITAEVLRSGGTKSLAGDALDEWLESRGASIETSTGNLTTEISVNALVEDSERVLEIVRDLLLEPAYPEDKLQLALTQARSGIARRNDDPSSIADREFQKILWGADHPFAAQMEYEHLARIGRDDLLAFHKKWYHPGDASLALWGDFNKDEIVATVQRLLGAWPKVTVQQPPIPATPEVHASVNLVAKESVTQSNLRLGHKGIKADNPDYYPLLVMNELLGGGLGSRLFNEVRSRQGLAYRVGSQLGAELAYPGMFRVVCGTKSETTVKAARACIEEVKRMKNTPVTDAELKRAKDGLLNSYVFNFADKGGIVTRQMNYARWGYPPDFLERFPQEVAKVTVADVQRVANSFLQPENFALLVVGKPADFDEALDGLGKVNTIDITIPEPKVAAFPAATPATLQKGKEVLAQAAKATGGVELLAKVSNLTESQDLQLSVMGNKMQAKSNRFVQYPGNVRLEIEVMGQTMVQVYNREQKAGFRKGMGQTKTLDEAEMQDFEDNLARELVAFLRDYESYKPQYLEDSEVQGAATEVILLTPPRGGKQFKAYVNKSTHLVVKLDYRSKSFQGNPVEAQMFLSEYKAVGGIKLPQKTVILQDGQPFLEAATSKVSITEPIPAEKFAKVES